MDAPSTLPTEPAERKTYPIATGVLGYFPDAIAAVAHVSYVGNEQHNPGEPLHWAREKSTDQEDTMLRHFLERGTLDKDGLRHSAKMVWRALAILQLEIEAERTHRCNDIPMFGEPTPSDLALASRTDLGWAGHNPKDGILECRGDGYYRGGKLACNAKDDHPFAYACTRPAGHTGDHVAEDTSTQSSWPQQPTPLQNCPRPSGAF